MLSHGCNQQQGCTNRHLGQNLAHGNTETVQKNIQGSNLLSCLVSSDAWLYSYLPWIRKDPLHLLTEGQCTGKVLFNRSDCELGRKRNAGGKEWLWVWSQWKRKFRLIILCGCEKSLFNNNYLTITWVKPITAILHWGHTNTMQLQQEQPSHALFLFLGKSTSIPAYDWLL